MAHEYGLCRTSRALPVEYYSLKKRVEQESAAAGAAKDGAAVATFVELVPPADRGIAATSMSGCEYTLELEDAGGARIRIHAKGLPSPDLAALSQSFWNRVS
jgi:hypothetical protein